jgi:hypothetical protein
MRVFRRYHTASLHHVARTMDATVIWKQLEIGRSVREESDERVACVLQRGCKCNILPVGSSVRGTETLYPHLS